MRFRLLTLSLTIALCLAVTAARADFIRRFDVAIKVQQDASLDVTEEIEVVFESQRHGIYRLIPVTYERYGNPFNVEFRLESITNDVGRSLSYSRARHGRDINLKIGDKDITVTGPNVYRLHYTVRRAVNFFGDSPELYWNATGDQWPYPIQSATVTVIPPPGVAPANVRTASFVGPPGSTAPGQMKTTDDAIVYSSPGTLAPGSGLTVVAGFPAGSVIKPSLMQELKWFISDWWPVAVFPLAALGIMGFAWRTHGRDENAGMQAVAVEFEPPKDLSPSEVGTLIDESCDTPDIIATLIDLAARGYLHIRELPSSKILFLSSKDYEFTRNPRTPIDDPLRPHEEKFLSGLFAGGNGTTRLSDQKNQFYTHIQTIRRKIYERLMNKQLFHSRPDIVRAAWRSVGFVIVVIGVLLTAALDRHRSYGIGLILGGVIVFLFAKAMPARTALGTRKLIECLSFKRFVTMVEKDRIKAMAMSDPTVFGRLLPYAMVLGVADQWADAFKDLLTVAPTWYESSDGRAFNSLYFINNLGNGMRTMERTMTSAPQSSSGGSGGSGFSGGSSGGGFGGGGGGNW